MPATGLGTAVNYEVTLEPHQQRWLLTLEATLQAPDITQRRTHPTANLQWLTTRPITEVLRYQAQAYVHYAYGQQLPTYQRNLHLRLPSDLNPRTAAWAQELRQLHGNDDMAIIQAALSHLSKGGYVYTLQPGEVSSAHTADHFWFESQRGFCEHIASAFTALMRAAGIPARLVTGYQGGERNTVDGLWTVRQSDAHAWTEVWLPSEGWMRVDPTSAVSPARIEQLQRLPASTTLLNDAMGYMVGRNVLQHLRANWEAVNHRWNDWVLNYSSDNQSNVLRYLQWTHWNAAKAALWFAGAAVLVALAFALQRWRSQRIRDPWLRMAAHARRKLQQAGITHAKSLGLQALARAAQAQWGDESVQLQQWLLQMEQWRYAPHGPDTPSLAALRSSYRALTWPRSRTP